MHPNANINAYIKRSRQPHFPLSRLNAVADHFLGDRKIDLPAAEIFRKFDATPQDRADIATYAVKDTELPLRLLAKLSVWENQSEMANAVNVPMDYLFSRGQQVRNSKLFFGVDAHKSLILDRSPQVVHCGMP